MAGCILSYAVYRELYLGKKDWKSAVLYILPLCFHLGILPLYAFRVIVRFFRRERVSWIVAILIAYVAIMYSGSLFSFLPFSLYNYVMKARSFFNGELEWGQYVFTSRFYTILRILFDITFVLVIIFLFDIIRAVKADDRDGSQKSHILFLYFIMQIAFFSIVSNLIVSEAFWRYGTLLFFFVPIILVYAKRYLSYNKHITLSVVMGILGLGITLMHIAMVAKNSILPVDSFIETASGFNIIKLLINDIKAMMG